jgi:uncharacterized protein YegP (UPF0339 family)
MIDYQIVRSIYMAAKFEIYKDRAKRFRFRLKAVNGEIIASGEAYDSKADCLKGIKSVQKNAPTAVVVDPDAAVKVEKKVAGKTAVAAKKPRVNRTKKV